jgi:hypothetical protein
MAKRETIRITLFDGGYNETVMSVPDAVKWLQELLDQIPEEYRAESVFQVEKESGYYDESDTLIFKVFYDRPETDAEVEERVAAEAASRATYARQLEARERAEFERLRVKFAQEKAR